MTVPSDGLRAAALVTSPDMRHSFVSHDPLPVLDTRYPLADGWDLRPVTGVHSRHGFVVDAVSAGQGAV